MRPLPVFCEESRVPTLLAGLAYGGCEVYPDPRLGASFRFGNEEGVKADVYLYDLGLPAISISSSRRG